MRIPSQNEPTHYFDSQAGRLVRESFRRSKADAEGLRMLDAQVRIEMLEDDWKDILLSKLWRIYQSPKIRDLMPGVISTEHNVYKRIVQELSRVYKYGATRELGTPAQTDIARQLWEECRLDERLAKANFYVNGVRDVGLAPRVIDGKMRLEIWLPDRTQVIQHDEDPTDAVAAWNERTLPNTQGYISIKRVYVDAEKWQIWDVGDGRNKPKVIEHPYGRMPVVWVHADERIDTFWGSTIGTDIVEATLSVGCDLFKLARMLQFQSELQPTYQGNPRDVAKGQTIGGDTLWAGKGTYNVLNLQGDPQHILSVIKARIGWIAQQYGLAADVYDLSSTATSGFQIRLKRQPLEEARISQVKTWRRVEKELLTVMAQVSQEEHPTLKLDPMAEFKTLDFHEEPLMEDPNTENTVDEANVKNNRNSSIDVLIRRNPDLSREQAIIKQRQIIDENAMVMGWQKESNSSMAPDADNRTPEENGRAGARARGRGGETDDSELRSRAAEALREMREAVR